MVVPLAMCAGVSTAAAQTLAPRPYRALFGGATTDPSVRQSLNLTVSLAEGYDDDVLATGEGPIGPGGAPALSGMFTNFAPAITYSWNGKSVQFSATGSSDVRYYQKTHEFLNGSHVGAFGFAAGNERTRVQFNQSVSYSPAYFYGMFPLLTTSDVGYPVGGDGDYSVNSDSVLVYDTSVNLSQRLTSKSTVALLGNFRYSDFSEVSGTNDLRAYGVGGRYSYGLSRHASLRMGYVYREGQYSYFTNAQDHVSHDIDVGIDYGRPLSFSRRTRLEFGIGSAFVNAPSIESSGERLEYRLVGNAALSHDMGRTWRARLTYNRGIRYIEGIQEPVFVDALNSSLDGFLSRRVDLHVGGGFSLGDVSSLTTQNRVHTYTASSRVRMALNQAFAVFADYVYYNYDSGPAVFVVNGVPRSLSRNTARVGLSAWLPLLRK